MSILRSVKKGQSGVAVRTLQQDLVKLGWPLKVDGQYGTQTIKAVHDFKRGFAFWNIGNEDGTQSGVLSNAALKYSLARGGRASKNYTFKQFKSKGNGWIKVHRDLLRGLEELVKKGQDKTIVSGYRDPAYNNKLPGAAGDSQHMYGNAADLDEDLTLSTVKSIKRFSGIGVQRSNGKVRHVDVRHVGPNTTNGSVAKPTVWYY